jgi:hypothetical protein
MKFHLIQRGNPSENRRPNPDSISEFLCLPSKTDSCLGLISNISSPEVNSDF